MKLDLSTPIIHNGTNASLKEMTWMIIYLIPGCKKKWKNR